MSGIVLRPYQEDAVAAVLNAGERGISRALGVAPTGCHRAGQGLLMFDGSVKAVEDVGVGDRLMGPDSAPRTVLRLVRGRGAMVDVRPTKGSPWVVNEDHVLTLVRTNARNANAARSNGKVFPSERGGSLIDVTVREWMGWSPYRKHTHKLLRCAVDFPAAQEPPVEPYAVGALLGDGGLTRTDRVIFTTPDEELVEWVEAFAASEGLTVRRNGIDYFLVGKKGPGGNGLLEKLRAIGLLGQRGGDRRVPPDYLIGSRKTRLLVLAGLLDTDGSLEHSGFDFLSKSRRLADDVAFLARSLGLSAYIAVREMKTNLGEGTYHRVSINGDTDIIPTLVARKQAPPRRQKKDAKRTGFEVEPTGTEEDYFGFTLDGDGRYLLDDFTVTHNSGKTIVLSEVIRRRTSPGHRTVLLAHRDELLRQAGEKLEMVAPGLAMDIGYVKASQNEVDKPIIIASVQTLARQSRREQMPRDIDTLIVDEAHHFRAISYQQVYEWLRPSLMLGVTATADLTGGEGLEKHFDEQVFGFSIEWMVGEGYLVPPRGRRVTVDVDLSKVKRSHGDFQADALADALEDAGAITDVLGAYQEHGEERKTLIFCPTVAMAHHTAAVFREAGLAAESLDGTTPADERAAILRRLHTGETQILANVSVLVEGFDEPSIGCIILAAPTKSSVKYTQIIGRGLRLWPGKENCLVIDLVDASVDNSLASLPALFGLKDLLDGEDVIEGREREAREAAKRAEEEQAAVDPAAERRRRNAESIQFFGRGRMNWTMIDDKWTIPLDRFRTIVLWPTAGEHFDVLLLNEEKESFKFLARGLDLGYAQGAAEETIRKHGNRILADSKAAWREDKVTPGQRGYLRRLGLEAPPTKGEAADLITEAKVAELLERVERALVEIEAPDRELERVA